MDVNALDRTEILIVYAIALIVLAFVIWGWARIFSKAGYSPLLGILMIVPAVGLVTFFWFAFSNWPVRRRLDPDTRTQDSRAA
jgi:hypothetical protein